MGWGAFVYRALCVGSIARSTTQGAAKCKKRVPNYHLPCRTKREQNGGMYDERFHWWSGSAPECEACARCRCAASRGSARSAQGRPVIAAFRRGRDSVCAGLFAAFQGACALGAGPCVAVGERAGVRACAQGFAPVARGGEPRARCALGDGGRRGLCWSGRCRGRGAWRAACAGFHGNQEIGDAGGGDGAARVVDPLGGCGGIECGAGAVARWLATLCAASLQRGGLWRACLGGGAVSGAGPCAWHVVGAA